MPGGLLDPRRSPSPGTPTIPLAQAVATALERNFTVLNSADSVATSRLREGVTRAQFYPKVTPRYSRSADDSVFGLDATQKLPWTGGSVTAAALMSSTFDGAIGPAVSPFPRTSDLRLVRDPAASPRLRAPTRPSTTCGRAGARARDRNGNTSWAASGWPWTCTRSYYQVIQQRQLLAVARQSLDRSESLRKASTARLEVGLVSKLDVYRAELQASQAQESMVRAEASLDSELERFRTLLGLSPSDPLQPEALVLPEDIAADDIEPVEVLTQRASKTASISWRRATRWATPAAPRPWPSRTSCPSST